jgi:hypothetical protein
MGAVRQFVVESASGQNLIAGSADRVRVNVENALTSRMKRVLRRMVDVRCALGPIVL